MMITMMMVIIMGSNQALCFKNKSKKIQKKKKINKVKKINWSFDIQMDHFLKEI